MMDGGVWTGGCACGFVRYEIQGRPLHPGYCHCRMCQRASGAPVMVFADVPLDRFAYVAGDPQVYQSSAWAERRFCPHCGTQLEFRLRDHPSVVEVSAATLDNSEALAPEFHVWTESRLPWFDTADALPRHRHEPGVTE